MRKRINWLFVLLTIVAIIVTTLLATIVNYTVLKQEVIDDLRIYAQTLSSQIWRRKYDTSFRDDRRQYDLLCGAFGQW